jgi:very-short-patch-repair endonuclease
MTLSSTCAACELPLKPTQSACRCGYSNAARDYVRPTATEAYFLERRFGNKKREALILHALIYALRDVRMVFQHPVPAAGEGNTRYLIDAYLPDFQIALEVDEHYHASDDQSARDRERQAHIEQAMGCTFRRINAHGRPIFMQIDDLVQEIRQLAAQRGIAPWSAPARDENQGLFRTGQFAQRQWDALEAAGAFADMEQLADQVRALGFDVRTGQVDGIPNPGNGEAGFILTAGPVCLMVYRRAASDALRLIVAGRSWPDHEPATTWLESQRLGPLEACQVKDGQARYYLFPQFPGRHARQEVLDFLAVLAARLAPA